MYKIIWSDSGVINVSESHHKNNRENRWKHWSILQKNDCQRHQMDEKSTSTTLTQLTDSFMSSCPSQKAMEICQNPQKHTDTQRYTNHVKVKIHSDDYLQVNEQNQWENRRIHDKIQNNQPQQPITDQGASTTRWTGSIRDKIRSSRDWIRSRRLLDLDPKPDWESNLNLPCIRLFTVS